MRAVLVAGGDPDPADAQWLDDADRVIAVDGGAAWLASIGRLPDALVGDLDSVAPSLVASLEASGVAIERHPTEKEASDTDLALDHARRLGASVITLIGALGGARLDHEVANLLLLARGDGGPGSGDMTIVRGETRVRCLRGGQTLAILSRPGALVSLLPIGGAAGGVSTSGLRYPLHDEPLPLGSTRGLSNEAVDDDASVQLRQGTLLVIETADEGVTK